MKVNIEVQRLCTNYIRGVPQYILNLLNCLVDRNKNEYSVTFFDYLKERNNRQILEKHIKESTRKNISFFECNKISYKTIMDCCRENNFSLFSGAKYTDWFGFDSDVWFFPLTSSLVPCAPLYSVLTIHDLLFMNTNYESTKAFKSMFTNTQNYIKNRKDFSIVTGSKYSKNDIVTQLNIEPERVFVTCYGYDCNTLYHDKNTDIIHKIGIDSPYVLFLGAVDSPYKCVPDILKAFSIIKERNYDLKLVLAGKYDSNITYSNEIRSHINNHKFKNDIILTGIVSEEEKRALLSCAEAFIFPSEYEGFGLPVLEAMACGSPVITTNVTSLPEVGGEAVLYVSPHQPEEIAEQAINLLNSDSLKQEYIQKGYERAKLFSWSKTAELTEKVFDYAYERKLSEP